MKIARNLLAILALVPSSVGFAGEAGAQAMAAKGIATPCSMNKVIHENKDEGVLTVDSWYMQTADDLRAKAQSPMACGEGPGCMDGANKETTASAAMTADSWYLQTADDLSLAARQPMTCEESQGHGNGARNDLKTDRATSDSWYLQTADDIRAASNPPLLCNAGQHCMTSSRSDSESTEPTSKVPGSRP